MRKIILASGSPRRSQLLQWAEVEFEVIVSSTDESYPLHLTTPEVAVHIATEKALAVQRMLDKDTSDEKIILAADTIVVLQDQIIGKPTDREDAIKILSELSGKVHEVITGVCILSGNKKILFAEETEVAFHHLLPEQITYYVDKYKPYDKAGAYAIQEWIGVTGVKSIEGDFYNVMGLPISKVVQHLKKLESLS